MSRIVLVDTDIIIDAGREIPAAIRRIDDEALRAVLVISTITHLELLVGTRNKREQHRIERLIARFGVVPLDPEISRVAVDLIRQYGLSHGLLIPDALIAATALSEGVPLLTKNQRDFRFISGLAVPPYP